MHDMKSPLSLLMNALTALHIVGLVAGFAVLGTLLFLGLGILLAWLSPLTLFQSIFVVIGSTIAVGLIVCIMALSGTRQSENDEYEDAGDEDWDFDEDEDDNDASAIETSATWGHTPGVGRNAPCPCGSGKKFKKCCGG
jgi:hypothetical protein